MGNQGYWDFHKDWSPTKSVAWGGDLSQVTSPGALEHPELAQQSSDERAAFASLVRLHPKQQPLEAGTGTLFSGSPATVSAVQIGNVHKAAV